MTNGGCGAKRQRREGSSVSQDSTFSPQSLSDTDYLAPFVHLEQSFKGSQKCIFHTFCSQDLFFFIGNWGEMAHSGMWTGFINWFERVNKTS